MAKSRTRLHAELANQIDQDQVTGQIVSIQTTQQTTVSSSLEVEGPTLLGQTPASGPAGAPADITLGNTSDGTTLIQNPTTQITSAATEIGVNPSDTVDINGVTEIQSGSFTVVQGATPTTINSDQINLGNANTDDINVQGETTFTGNRVDIDTTVFDITSPTINIGDDNADSINLVGSIDHTGNQSVDFASTGEWERSGSGVTNFNSTGTTTFNNGNVDINTQLDVDNININGNTIGSTTGNTVINGSGILDIQDNTTFAGTTTTTGLATFNGGVTIQSGDTFTFDGQAITDLKEFIIRDAGGTAQLGGFLMSTNNAGGAP